MCILTFLSIVLILLTLMLFSDRILDYIFKNFLYKKRIVIDAICEHEYMCHAKGSIVTHELQFDPTKIIKYEKRDDTWYAFTKNKWKPLTFYCPEGGAMYSVSIDEDPYFWSGNALIHELTTKFSSAYTIPNL